MSTGFNLLLNAVKNPLFRNFVRGKGIDDAILDTLLANANVGQPSETPFAFDLLPILLRLVGGGLLNFQVAGTNRDFVWPIFLSRQLDPEDGGFCVRGHNPLYLNQHYRNWTGIGRFGDLHESVVDPAGLLTPRFHGYSIDMWVRDPEGSWHFPSRTYGETGHRLKQTLVENLPAVETRLSLDEEHELVSLAYVQGFEEVSLAVLDARVEGPNASEFDVIASLRPANPEGLSLVSHVKTAEDVWWMGKDPIAVFAGKPFLQGALPFVEGDIAWHLQRGRGAFPAEADCRTGLATAFAAFKEKVLLWAPTEPVTGDDASFKKLREQDQGAVYEEVLSSWRNERASLPALNIADKKAQDLYEACQSWMLLFYDRDPLTDKDQITPGPLTYHHFWFRDAAYLVSTLDRMGRHDLASRILYTYPHRQQEDGFYISQEGEWDANGQAMWTLFHHYRLTRNEKFLREMYPSMARGAKWIARKRKKGARDPQGLAKGLLPAGMSAEHLGANDYYYWDDFWCLRGLLDAAAAARILGKKEDAEAFQAEADAFRTDIEISLGRVAERLGEAVIPASPLARINSGAIGSLCASYPTEVLPADDERLLATIAAIRADSFYRDGFFQHIYHSGTNIYLSLQVAQCELRAGRPAHQHIFRRVAALGSPTWTYPEAVHPHTSGGCMGDGHHGWAAAEVINYLHACFAIEEEDRLTLLKGVHPEWFGDGAVISLGPLPTIFGKITVKVRKEGGAAVVDLDADWHAPPLTIRVHSPGKPADHKDFDPTERELRVSF